MGNSASGNENIPDFNGLMSTLSLLSEHVILNHDTDDEDSDSDSYTGSTSSSDTYDMAALSDMVSQRDVEVFDNLRSTLSSMQKKNYSNYELHYEIVNGNVRAVTDILHTTQNINLKLSTKYIEDIEVAPIHLAVKYNHFEIVKILLEKDISILNSKNIFGSTPFLMAVDNQFENIAQLLLQKGADVNVTNNERCTALHFAAFNNQTKMVEFLIKNGADVHAKNYRSSTPLHFAALNGSIESMELLIKNNANINCLNDIFESPLENAAWGLLIIPLAGVMKRDTGTKSETEKKKTQENKMKAIKLLHDHGGNIQQRDSDGNTLLHVVSREDTGYAMATDYLIDKGLDVNSCNNALQTPLHDASVIPSTASMYSLIRNGADLNAEDENGKTPLHNAARCGNLDAVKLLVNHGANIMAVDEDQDTPSDVAEMTDHEHVVAYLAEAVYDRFMN